MRIFALSDLHVDYSQNRQWVQALSVADYQNDVLILAGDLTDNYARLAECFEQLAGRFRSVVYVPGNHELWVMRSKEPSSLEKFWRVKELAESQGILTETLVLK